MGHKVINYDALSASDRQIDRRTHTLTTAKAGVTIITIRVRHDYDSPRFSGHNYGGGYEEATIKNWHVNFLIPRSVLYRTRGQSNLTKCASRGGGHSPVRGQPRGRKLYH